MEIKAIETRYGGCRFRSRLEARWAVYFDALGIEWEYEKEGYDLGGLLYLPDFWLPQVSMWAEVKPVKLNPLETEKAKRLVLLTGYPMLLLVGPPAPKSYWAYEPVPFAYWDDESTWDDMADEQKLDALKLECDYVLNARHLHEHRFFFYTGETFGEEEYDASDHEGVVMAVEAARSARFDEHLFAGRRST